MYQDARNLVLKESPGYKSICVPSLAATPNLTIMINFLEIHVVDSNSCQKSNKCFKQVKYQ